MLTPLLERSGADASEPDRDSAVRFPAAYTSRRLLAGLLRAPPDGVELAAVALAHDRRASAARERRWLVAAGAELVESGNRLPMRASRRARRSFAGQAIAASRASIRAVTSLR